MSSSMPQPEGESSHLSIILAAGFTSAVVLGVVVFLSARTDVLDLPQTETSLLAALTALVSLAGWIGLRAGWSPRRIGWGALLAYTLLATLAVHYTGGPQTPMPSFYLLIVVAASFVLGRRGTTVIALASVGCYALLLALEFAGWPMVYIWRIQFDPRNKGLLLVVNWLTVATPVMLTAFMSGRLAGQLRLRNQQLEQMGEARKDLVNMLVHDLRNPLTVLLSTLDLIRLTLKPQLSEDHHQLLNGARRSGHLMVAMLNDILDVAKLEAGRLDLQWQATDLTRLLAEAADQYHVLAELGDVALRAEVPPGPLVIQADAQLVGRVLANLVLNAIKYTPPKGAVTLAAEAAPAGFVTVRVADTGEGIPPDQRDLIFEKFGQVKQEGPRQGTGLGLTLCKMAVEAHGGKIWVESVMGQGSQFIFTLPVERTPQRARP
jgi:signal transduction histidine kinase